MAFRLEIENFGAFYERTYPGAFRTALAIVANPALAADVTQDAFMSAYRSRTRFRGDSPAEAWLHRIVVNESLAAIRRRRPVVRNIVMKDGTGSDNTRGSADRLALLDALAALDPRHRAAIVLRYYHGYDYAAIAHILGTSTGNVGVMLTRSLDRLRTRLEPSIDMTSPAEAIR